MTTPTRKPMLTASVIAGLDHILGRMTSAVVGGESPDLLAALQYLRDLKAYTASPLYAQRRQKARLAVHLSKAKAARIARRK